MSKHYTIEVHEAAPKGALLRYAGIEATGKKDLAEKVTTWNKEHLGEYMALKTAFVLHD